MESQQIMYIDGTWCIENFTAKHSDSGFNECLSIPAHSCYPGISWTLKLVNDAGGVFVTANKVLSDKKCSATYVDGCLIVFAANGSFIETMRESPFSCHLRNLTTGPTGLFSFKYKICLRKFGQPLLRQLYESSNESDFTVVAQGASEGDDVNIPVHKFILSSYSKVFKRMFRDGLLVKHEKLVYINDFSSDCVKVMLQFMYDDYFELRPAENPKLTIEVLRIADKYHVWGLRSYAAKKLQDSVAEHNCATVIVVLQHARLFGIKDLLQSCLNRLTSLQEFNKARFASPQWTKRKAISEIGYMVSESTVCQLRTKLEDSMAERLKLETKAARDKLRPTRE